jgi:hypothetical protein
MVGWGEKHQAVMGAIMAARRVGEAWYSRMLREWPIILFTAAVTAILTALFSSGGQYVATVMVENAKVRSGNIVKLSDDFQSRFSAILTALQNFNGAVLRDKTISQKERAELSSTILTMQLSMSPATGRWPNNIVYKANNFFSDLAELELIVRNSSVPSDLDPIEKTVRRLVTDDMEITRAMQQEAQIRY